MRTLNKLFNKSDRFSKFAKKYFNYLSEIQKNMEQKQRLKKRVKQKRNVQQPRNTKINKIKKK